MKERKPAVARGKRTVLVVEDNDMNREILCALLEDDYLTVEASDGLEGLEVLEARYKDLSMILLDVYMPRCDGFAFLERKRADPRFDGVPVIMMTASNTVDDEIRCLELGASDFITKPYNAEVLKNRMWSIIRLRESSTMLGRLELDSLTGLYSKEFFYHNVDETLRSDPEGQYDFVCSDIENFRAMNDRYGQEWCDRVLRTVAERLARQLEGGVVLGGRVGADILAFLVTHAERDWEKLLTAAAGGLDNRTFNVKHGVYAMIDTSANCVALCDRATMALSRIKRRFNTDVAFYDDEMRRVQIMEHQIVDNMQESLARHEFQVYYQPKHNLHTDRIGGAEALVRWIHPEMGFVNPGVFIPLFERNGFVTQLDFYIWEEVCRELRRIADAGLPAVPISINVSRMDFESPDLAAHIAELADRYGVDHALLHIEVTESFYADNPKRITATLEALHNDGFIIELDDFGSGYSSLSSLNTLRLDIMKLDMSLIRQASATKDYSILRFATLLADGMRLKTVAEGVETEDEVAALKVLGCDYIQGYYYAKPMPRADYEDYLAAHSA